MRIDLHVHTSCSYDALIRPADLAKKSKKLGIIPAILDHNTIGAHEAMRRLDASFIPGIEVQTDQGDLAGLYIQEGMRKGMPLMEAHDIIRSQGGLVYLPHMFDKGRHGIAGTEAARKADIIEIFNARCLDSRLNQKAEAFAKSSGLPGAVGSDSHFLFEFGRSFTEVPDFDLDNPKELLQALGSAEHTMRKAPFLVRGTTSMVSLGKRLISF